MKLFKRTIMLFSVIAMLVSAMTISEIEYGLTRIKVQDQADDYYYVPAISLKGSVEYVGQESNKTYYVSENPEVLVVINAIDGTVINRTNS